MKAREDIIVDAHRYNSLSPRPKSETHNLQNTYVLTKYINPHSQIRAPSSSQKPAHSSPSKYSTSSPSKPQDSSSPATRHPLPRKTTASSTLLFGAKTECTGTKTLVLEEGIAPLGTKRWFLRGRLLLSVFWGDERRGMRMALRLVLSEGCCLGRVGNLLR